MKNFDINTLQLRDTAAESVTNTLAEEAALESHLQALQEHLAEVDTGGGATEKAELKLQIARTLVELKRGAEAWSVARRAFAIFIEARDFESAADLCDILFRCDQSESLSALGQGIWLSVTYPIDPDLTVELLSHVVEETPGDADGAAVAATAALYLADLRADGNQRENLMFFASQILGRVASQHSGVNSQEAFDLWMERLELKEPDKFLVRLRNIVDVLVQDNWWFDREALQAELPVN